MIGIIYVLSALFVLILSQTNSSEGTSVDLHAALKGLQSQIDQKTKKHGQLRLKFSRLFETTLPFQGEEATIQNISALQSINLPYKDNFQYPIMIKNNQKYSTLRGDIVYSGNENSTTLGTLRNEYTFFAEMLENRTMILQKLKLINKQPQLTTQIAIDFSLFNNFKPNNLFVINPTANQANYVFVDYQNGVILGFDRHKQKNIEFKVEGKIIQMEKMNYHLVILTQRELFTLNVNSNFSKNSCLVPQKKISSFAFEDSNFKVIYAAVQDSIYLYDLGQPCRPIKTYPSLKNSSFFITSQLILLQAQHRHFAINLTDDSFRPINLPVTPCEGPSKIAVTRKIMTQYIVSRICLKKKDISISHILIDLESNSTDVADFSKFRVPLLLFSFAVIIYVTVKNKKKENVEKDEQKVFKDLLLGRDLGSKEALDGLTPEDLKDEAFLAALQMRKNEANFQMGPSAMKKQN